MVKGYNNGVMTALSICNSAVEFAHVKPIDEPIIA